MARGKGAGGVGLRGPAWLIGAAALLGAVFFGGAFDPEPLGERASGGGQAAISEPASAPSFDYYVLALSWSPSFCRENPTSDQCGRGHRFILHGLWPQYEEGWPQDCDTAHPRPSSALLRSFASLGATEGLLAYQWRKHGSCSGLSPQAYFETAAEAVGRIAAPPAFERLSRDRRVDPRSVETEFLRANPFLERDGVTIRCANGRFSEVRICLTRALEPRRCGADVVRDCDSRSIALPAPR